MIFTTGVAYITILIWHFFEHFFEHKTVRRTFRRPLLPAGELGKTFLINIPLTKDPVQLSSTCPPTMDIPRELFSSRCTCKVSKDAQINCWNKRKQQFHTPFANTETMRKSLKNERLHKVLLFLRRFGNINKYIKRLIGRNNLICRNDSYVIYNHDMKKILLLFLLFTVMSSVAQQTEIVDFNVAGSSNLHMYIFFVIHLSLFCC